MPTYLYQREDGSEFEIEQKITAPRLTTCPTTGQPVKRLVAKTRTMFGFHSEMKGSKFMEWSP